MDEYIKFKADEFGFYNGVDFSVYAVQVQNAIHVILIADNGKPKNPQNIGMLTGSAYCHEGDTFDLDYGVRLAVERAIKKDFPMIWRGFRRAQWHKLHDVTDEQMFIDSAIDFVSEADGWIPVSERLPEGDPLYSLGISVDVEAKFADNHTEKYCWCNLRAEEWERYGRPIERRRDVVAWRPMRGGK